MTPFDAPPRAIARAAGACYLVIIVCGLWSELAVRGVVRVPGDAEATAANILAFEGLFRAAMVADLAMGVADVALAVLLAALLWQAGPLIAAMAAAFRLVQAGVLGANLTHHDAALAAAQAGAPGGAEAALRAMELHAAGYDLGLVFFGVNCLLTGWLLWRSALLPRVLGAGIAAAGAVYLTGSLTRVMAPDLVGIVAPAYVVPLLAESALCLWLLVRGVRVAPPEARRA